MNGHGLIPWLLTQPSMPPEPPQTSYDQWCRRYEPAALNWKRSLERAAAGGFVADRLAWVLAAGYGEALRALLPNLPAGEPSALCVTEAGGNHPRAMETRLQQTGERWKITGAKTFVTGAELARWLLVAATTGQGKDGRPRLRLVRLPADIEGLTIDPMPPLPFVPEIPHGTLTLDRVVIEAQWLLPGDGYARYIKPFRTLEDLHLMAAALGYLYRTAATASWPISRRSELLAFLAGLLSLDAHDPSAPGLHIVLGGFWMQITSWLESVEPLWQNAPAEWRRNWQRDRPLLNVAEKARSARLASAWRQFEDERKHLENWSDGVLE